MNREQAKTEIKRAILCTDYLQKSKNNMYCCPYCGSGTHGGDSDGAVKYYSETNTFYCHACDKGGDAIDAYRLQEGCDYNTALLYLAERAGVKIDARPTAAQEFTEAEKSSQSDATEKKEQEPNKAEKGPQIENNGGTAADYRAYYKECCDRITDAAASSYLQARGISLKTAQACHIGFDPQADPASAPGATGNAYKPHPTPRIIAPCSKYFYIARSIDPATPAAFKAPNPKGSKTMIFNAAAIYSGADVVFITEGVFDALSFIEVGQAAISLNGKGNGKLLLQLLQDRPAQTAFIICHDNDDDTQTAADTMKRATELNNQLRSMNYKSIIYNVAGSHHDANAALTADLKTFAENTAAAIKELQRDDLTDFLAAITTEAYKPHRTGLNFFDNLLSGGIIQQSLLLLMAAPGAGKTTLAQQLAEQLAKQQRPVIYFNFEMSKEQMLAKAISAKLYSSKGIKKTTTGILQGYKWTDAERSIITEVIEEYRQTQYPFIKYNPAGTSTDLDGLLSYLTATGEAAKARGEQAPAAVIDYLHLITSSKGLDLQELIKQAVKGLKDYAVKYNTFVIGIIASNRDSNKKGKLTMESGRDSSNLEYTADYQISLNYYDIDNGKIKATDTEAIAKLQEAEKRAMILRVLKSRFSQPGKSEKVLFDAAHNTFYGTCDEFIPPTGFILDSGAPAFDD